MSVLAKILCPVYPCSKATVEECERCWKAHSKVELRGTENVVGR